MPLRDRKGGAGPRPSTGPSRRLQATVVDITPNRLYHVGSSPAVEERLLENAQGLGSGAQPLFKDWEARLSTRRTNLRQ